jgi:hypothetical protein
MEQLDNSGVDLARSYDELGWFAHKRRLYEDAERLYQQAQASLAAMIAAVTPTLVHNSH